MEKNNIYKNLNKNWVQWFVEWMLRFVVWIRWFAGCGKNSFYREQITLMTSNSGNGIGQVTWVNRRYISTKNIKKNLSLVIWSSNLTSQVGNDRFTKQVSNMVNCPLINLVLW